ncbi:carbamoyltransferase HypF [Desulfobacterales bacterium HSG17]|nr:carbamoyltransferase HypF [Desulfobacterales bacterium HSG17]
MEDKIAAKQLEINGVVQGVGFRPFLFTLAQQYGLTGEVYNTPGGVLAKVEGSGKSIDKFVHDIQAKQPLLASVNHIAARQISVKGFKDFQIIQSKSSDSSDTLISPDVSICTDCLFEMLDPNNRRFEYPFINCTNCGPRFTIIKDIPYDRPKTSMNDFQMCPDCLNEYENPMDRRFHAQPNACKVCGPNVFLTDNSGRKIDLQFKDVLEMAGKLLKKGKILAIKGLGGFHLAVDASNDKAVHLLRQKKQRPHKPFALMARPVLKIEPVSKRWPDSKIFEYVHVSDKENRLLNSFRRPIVLLEKKILLKKKQKAGNTGLSPAIAPLNTCLGVMLPYTPLHYLLLEKGPDILVMTSGNRPGEPLSIDNKDALDAFSHIADYFLFHDRDIYFRADDSIVRVQAGHTRFFRRSRGYAPLPLELDMIFDKNLPSILGCGAGMKNTICLTKKSRFFLSQHIGEIDNHKVYDFYNRSIDHLKKILNINPKIIAHDMHPDYMSTQYAKNLARIGKKSVAIQHHHAHAVSCMAENGINEPVIAITLDGTGYGIDGNIWGGEILLCTPADFTRKAHLAYINMPGGDKTVLEPWRMAASVLFKTFGTSFMDLDIQYIKEMDTKKLEFITDMIQKNLNSPLTSSAGRLFDAVSSLLCQRHIISHESQAAMELEYVAAEAKLECKQKPYAFSVIEKNSSNKNINSSEKCFEIDFMPCIREIVGDLMNKTSNSIISQKFHQTMITSFAQTAKKIALATEIDKIVLSGGVFNNNMILTGMIKSLEENNLKVFTHSKIPAGDGGICLGQVVSAVAQM